MYLSFLQAFASELDNQTKRHTGYADAAGLQTVEMSGTWGSTGGWGSTFDRSLVCVIGFGVMA